MLEAWLGALAMLAMAAEWGDGAVAELRDVLAFYEAMRASESLAR